MIKKTLLRTVENQSVTGVQFVTPVAPTTADGLVAAVYNQIHDEYMNGEPFMLHSPSPEILAGMWSILRESFVAGQVPRLTKEAVAMAVSKTNECPFCAEFHALTVYGGRGGDIARAIERGDYSAINDPAIRGPVEWAAMTRTPDAAILSAPPFSRQEAPEIIGTALTFHYINRMVNVFCPDSAFPLPPALSGLQAVLYRLASPLMRDVMMTAPKPGASLAPLPRVDLPDDLSWAAPNETIAAAFAGFAAIVEQRTNDVVSHEVQRLLRDQLDSWNGDDPGFRTTWLDDAIATVSEDDQPAARLALLTALASYRVSEDDIDAFRAQHPTDEALIVLTSWASFTAARKIGTWLQPPAE